MRKIFVPIVVLIKFITIPLIVIFARNVITGSRRNVEIQIVNNAQSDQRNHYQLNNSY